MNYGLSWELFLEVGRCLKLAQALVNLAARPPPNMGLKYNE